MSTTTSAGVRLSVKDFSLLWTELRLGRKPYPLDVSHGSATEGTQLDGVTRDRAAMLLQVLDQHTVSVDAIADIDGPVRALAASDGVRAVLALVEGDDVTLTSIRPTALASEMTSLLPDAEAGSGHAFAVPFAALKQAASAYDDGDYVADEDDAPWGGGGYSAQSALASAGVSTKDAALLDEIASTRTAGGQFGVTRGAQRSPILITWFDTDKGRYLMVRDGAWLSIAPADDSRISSRIDAVLSTLL